MFFFPSFVVLRRGLSLTEDLYNISRLLIAEALFSLNLTYLAQAIHPMSIHPTSEEPTYKPPAKVEELFAATEGNKFASINAPTAGAREEKGGCPILTHRDAWNTDNVTPSVKIYNTVPCSCLFIDL